MRTGKIEANLVKLNEEFRLPYIPGLVERKVLGSEAGCLDTDERSFHQTEYSRLILELEAAASASTLPEEPGCRNLLDDLLIRVRLRNPSAEGSRNL